MAPILLVDDEPSNLLALEAVLQVLGEPLVRAGSGEEALRQLRDADFAAVLLDVHMPGMDGFETASLIRAQRRSRGTPIIFITADSSDLSIEAAYAMGAVDFLTKPIMAAVLKAKVAFFVELHRSKQELQVAERQAVQDRVFLSAVLEAVEDGIVACDANGTLTLFNRATRQFHGLDAQSVGSQRWSADYHLFRPDGLTPLPRNEVPLYRALAGEHVRDAAMVIAPPAGRPRMVLASGQPLHDDTGRKLGAVVSMHDVTSRQEAEMAREAAAGEQIRREEAEAAAELIRQSREQLRASEERVRLATQAAGLGVWVWDTVTDQVTWENERLHAIFGLPVSEMPISSPRFLSEFAHPDDADAMREQMGLALHDAGRLHLEGRIIRRSDGAIRWIEATGVAQAAADGTSRRILGTVSDITERKEAEGNLRRLASELAESDRRKTEFLATLAHELRNPLAPISNGLQMMRIADGDLQVQERARTMMERQLKHMVHLVDDLLDIARISSNKVELRRQQLDLKAVLASAVETSMPLITGGNHTLEVSVPDDPMPVSGDATRLAQVVSNLLNNAARYTPSGGRIELSAKAERGQAVVQVSDTGTGIEAQALPSVFEMFTQVGRDSDRSQGGLGIGLALVQRLVQLHGGEVEAHSEGAGRGSNFIVRLPLSAIPAPASSVPPAGQAPAPAPAGVRVLVVDDNADAAESLAALLEMQGHQTRVANDGDEALRTANDFHPHIVFLDIGMPGKDGYAVAREMRAGAGTRDAVLVALTGWGAREDRARSRSAGFDHHLTKPASLEAVDALLAQLSQAPSDKPVNASS